MLAARVAGELVRPAARRPGHDLVRGQVGQRRLAEELADGRLDHRHARRAADHDHALDVGWPARRAAPCAPPASVRATRSRDSARTARARCAPTAPRRRAGRRAWCGRPGSLSLAARAATSTARLSRPSPPRLACASAHSARVVEIVAAERRVAAGSDDLEHAGRQAQQSRCRRCRRPGRRPRTALRAVFEAVGHAAAVSSLIRRRTFRPASCAASLVAWRWASSKYAGTVITAPKMSASKLSSARRAAWRDLRRDLDRRLDASHGAQLQHARRVDEVVGQPARLGEVGERAAHEALDRDDRVLGVEGRVGERVGADDRAQRRGRRPCSAPPTAGSRGHARRAGTAARRCAPPRRASAWCPGRCRSRSGAGGGRDSRPAPKSAAMPSRYSSSASMRRSRSCSKRSTNISARTCCAARA